VRVVVWIVIAVSAQSAWAHEPRDGDIHASLGQFNYMSHSWHDQFVPPVMGGPVLSVEGDLSDHGGLEISMFYLQNNFSISDGGRVFTEGLKRIYISTGYRHWFSPILSGGLGFASSFAMGNPFVVHDDFGLIPHRTTSARDINEYAFDFSVQYEPWRFGRFGVVFDGRYSLNITPKKNEIANHVGFIVALKYFVQSRQVSKEDMQEEM
jgi:hypothetical protein